MKKVASILLLSLLLFNWVGYQFYISFADRQLTHQLEAKLDQEDYDAASLISVKVPAAHLPYYTNSKSFERVDGQMDIAGVRYNYVKKRIYNDSLELLCIPNADAMKLQSAKDNFFRLVNDLQHNGAGKKSNSPATDARSLSPDYFASFTDFPIASPADDIVTGARFLHTALASTFHPVCEQPPDLIS